MHAAEATSVGSPPSGAANQLRGGLNDLLGLPSPRCTPVSVRPPPILGSAGNDAPGEGEEGESSPQEPLDSGEGDADSSTSHEFTMELIGRGACGCVYKSIWDGQTVAIKVIEHEDETLLETHSDGSPASTPNLDLSATSSLASLAWLEAALCSGLNHTNVVKTLDCQTHDPFYTARRATGLSMHAVKEMRIVMEYCDLGPLDVAVGDGRLCVGGAAGNPVDMEVVCITLAEVADALAFLHGKNILHRDLKAKNVLLKSSTVDRRNFVAKVTDFGLSTQMMEGARNPVADFCGTASHMAPELLTDGLASPATDAYAFGILMWEAYCGGPPYGRLSKTQIMVGVATQDLRPVFPPDTPAWYQDLAARCWNQNPDLRPEISDVRAELLAHANPSWV